MKLYTCTSLTEVLKDIMITLKYINDENDGRTYFL